ncbi:LolA family protein [Aureispira anguillae]|uniref:Outer membrane lipoprotein carrier protein LolA n=1 Tax=Aureispira anguillae TaxID=2864201 RepID=A0A916DSZ6_9BACT|nr:outer membrane lipoprotein carrier protein LolA [Aureispira anguillae]BDS11397.1 outer membrane lipoprotein carrier protein LolA [Aureispira anguillae]
MKWIKNVLSISFLFLMVVTVNAQTKQAFKEKSDPEATKILKNLKKIYGKYEGIEIEYNLELEYGDDKEVQSGKILQAGDKYRINNNGNIIINDGETVWMYIKKQNEVQINDYIADEGTPFTPAKIFNIDENDEEFVYVITGEDNKGYKIEFKPRDRDSEIMKIRIRVDKAQSKINSVKVFSDDGSRMTFLVKSIKNTKPVSKTFQFNKDKHPGVKVIDLRD